MFALKFNINERRNKPTLNKYLTKIKFDKEVQ